MTTIQELSNTTALLRTQAESLAAEIATLEAAQVELGTTKTKLTEANARINVLLARIAELEARLPKPTTVFSFDVSSLGSDANLSETTKINSHKALFGVDNVQNLREFFNSVAATKWNSARLSALTEKDGALISFKAWDRLAFRKLLASTPEKFRQRKGQIKWAFWHEFEGDWKTAADKPGWTANFLKVYAEMADELDASPWDIQSRDDLVKIFLWYSQVIDGATKGQWKQFIGDQKFGMIGMDCYHYQAWGAKGRYATSEELFGPLVEMGKETGLPICVPEWGGELASGDGGAGLAKAIAEGGEFQKKNGILFSNWWCATGSIDAVTKKPRDHHVDNVPAAKAALASLIKG
jgi:hypothetical protein